ncbi:MAG TPA: cupin domain-containing protein [Bryobacteraceae bacterium]|nr:cupin domain-containing protein [Bryobacteraceae bacterium]
MVATQIAGAARSFPYLGNHVTIHADASDTNGNFAVLEILSKPGAEPPMHVHDNADEMFIVIEGQMQLTCGTRQSTLSAGESGIVKRGTPHTFKILTPALRSMTIFTPAGFEEFFRSLAGEPPPPFEVLAQAAAKYGSRILR